MAYTYKAPREWGVISSVPLDNKGDPVDTDYKLCRILSPRFGLSEPGNMTFHKYSGDADYPYLVTIKDVDNTNTQVLIPDFPSLLEFFEHSFAFSFLFVAEQNFGDLSEKLERLLSIEG